MTKIETVQQYFRALDLRDYEAVAERLSDDLEFVTPVEPLDKPTFMEFIKGLLDAFPDWSFNHGDFRLEDDRVSTPLKMTGTHTETLRLPLPGLKPVTPTGKHVVLPEQRFYYTIRDTRIVRIEGDPVLHAGIIGTLEQIGVRLPPLWIMKTVAKVAKIFRRSRSADSSKGGGL